MFSKITAAAPSARNAVTVVGVTSDGKTVPAAHAKVPAVADALDTPGFAGDNGEVVMAGPKHVLLGLGASDAVTPATVRTAAAKLVKALDRRKAAGVTVDLAAGFPRKRAEVEALGRAFGEGLAMANWRVDRFDGEATKRQPRGGALAVDAKDADFRDGLRRGLLLGGAVNYAREIGATPPNVCNPAWVAGQARRLARECGLKCTVIDHARAALPDDERRRVRRHLPVDCACGRITDAACPWRGPWRETVCVEYVPEWVRDSHRAAGNSGTYPANGAIRVRVQRQCAAEIQDWAGQWARIVRP